MQKLILLLVFAAAATTVGAMPASASVPQPVTIEMTGQLTGPNTVAGTWTASGAFTDSGTYTEMFELAGETIRGEKVLVGALGTMVMKARSVLVWTTPTTATFKAGSWEIAGGTGAYERLHAGGTPLAAPGSYGDVATGAVHVSHLGEAHFD
jgi:hypothetical protein